MTRAPGFGFLIFVTIAIALAIYFAVAAVQGDLGVLERLRIKGDIATLVAQRDTLQSEVEMLRNKTLRLSDHYLDLDLLDEQARRVLGLMRADELVVR